MTTPADEPRRGGRRASVIFHLLAPWLPGVFVAIVGAAVRLPGVGAPSLWLDELAQVFVARSPLPVFLQGVRSHLAAAPLDYLGTKLAIATIGRLIPDITLAAHVWPQFCGIATVVVTWGLTNELTGSRRAAIAAGLMAALSGFLVFYSQEARPYSMAALMAVLSIWVFARATRLDRRRDWLVVGVVAVLSVYTHYFLGFVLAMEGVALVLVRSVRLATGRDGAWLARFRPVATFAAIGLVTLAAFAPWYLFATVTQLSTVNGYPPIEALTPERIARLMTTLLAAVPSGGVPTRGLWTDWFLTAGILAGAVVGAARVVRRRPEPGLALVGFAMALVPVVWLFDIQSKYFVSERQFIFLLPMVYVLAGSGFDTALTRIGDLLEHLGGIVRASFVRVAPIALATVLLSASVAPLERVYGGEFVPKEDWRSAAALTAHALCPDGRVYVNVGASNYYGVTLYAPQLASRVVGLLPASRNEYLLDTIGRYPITHRDVIVILVPVFGVFMPGRGGIANIVAAMKVKGFGSVGFSGDRIRVLYAAGGCAS